MMPDAYPSACCFHRNLLNVYGSKQQGSAFVGANGMLASADGATPAVARATACAEEATRMDYSPKTTVDDPLEPVPLRQGTVTSAGPSTPDPDSDDDVIIFQWAAHKMTLTQHRSQSDLRT